MLQKLVPLLHLTCCRMMCAKKTIFQIIKVEFLFVLGCQIPEDTPVAQNQLSGKKYDPEKSPKYGGFPNILNFHREAAKSCSLV